ncbi:DUF1003 domain-containing protein [Dermacoccaceae bacterium W4C1]
MAEKSTAWERLKDRAKEDRKDDRDRDERKDTGQQSRPSNRNNEAKARLLARRERPEARLDQPQLRRRSFVPRSPISGERFGVLSEKFARFMGTATFLIWMTVFVALWLAWNTFMPPDLQFDPRALNYTLLTLILSLQASYAAPLILLAQNRQDDRDRVGLEQDRSRDERNLADTEYLTREVASLRLALRDTATRDFVRSELRSLLEEMSERGMLAPQAAEDAQEPDERPATSATPAHSVDDPGAHQTAPAARGDGATRVRPTEQPQPGRD